MAAIATSPDPLLAVPPPAELRRALADLTRRRTLLQALLRASIRIENYPPPSDSPPTSGAALSGPRRT